MSLVLLFPGQGVQHPAMLPWLDGEAAAAPVLAAMARTLGHDWRQRLADPGWCGNNTVAQCLLTGTGLAALQVLRQYGLPEPMACAGYSVGELAAFAAAGVFDAETALALAAARSAAMDRCAPGQDGGLLAVAGAGPEAVAAACRRWSLQVAIRIATDRCVLGGEAVGLNAAAQELARRGADVKRLPVRIASHTSAMRPAAEALAGLVAPMDWRPPRPLLVTNHDGRVVRAVAALKTALCAQVAATVRWQEALQTLAERRPRCVLEVGAGSSLSRHWLALRPAIPSRSADEFGGARSVVAWVRACLRD